jgi:hypothetical protein
MCAYFSESDIEQYTGFGAADFKQNGVTMTATQWSTFCATIVDFVTQLVNRYCNVVSFEPHEVTEYRNGMGAQGDGDTYIEEDITFYLGEQATGIRFYEDYNTKTGTEYFVERTCRSTSATGDYDVATRYGLTMIRFHDNYPKEGWHNVKITYWGGYETGSKELDEIKHICLDIATEILRHKKKLQESTTIRATGVRDYAEMFKIDNDAMFLTDGIKQRLHKYRKYRMGGASWW